MTGSAEVESTPAPVIEPGPLPEVAVADASPAVGAVFREIAALSGIALPALIWRHMATRPDILDEAWLALRPLFVNGQVQDAAWRAANSALTGQTSSVTRTVLRAVHLPEGAEEAYGRVLDSYNRANPVNVVAMLMLLAGASASPSKLPTPHSVNVAWVPPTPPQWLPPMTPVSEIRIFERQQIDRLAADKTIDRSRVVPSLYRHLAEWPALIRLIHNALEPRMRSGEVAGLMSRLNDDVFAEVNQLAPYMPHLPRLAAAPGLLTVVQQFTSGLIPEMIVVGHLLRAGLDRAN